MKIARQGHDCPECECDGVNIRIKWEHGMDTQWAPGCPIWRLDWWRCPECRSKFVTQHGGEPDLAAW
jgi:hypothetical protein